LDAVTDVLVLLDVIPAAASAFPVTAIVKSSWAFQA
jgi:hypothetical protein